MFKGTFPLTISSTFFILSAYLINVILGRFLGPESFGTYGVLVALMTAVNIVQTSGLPQAISKFISSNPKESEAILKSGIHLFIGSTMVISLLYFLSAYPLSILLQDFSLVGYIQLSALIFPTYGLYTLLSGYYNGLHQFGKQSLFNIVYSIAKALFVVCFGLLFGIAGALSGFVIAPICAVILGIRYPRTTYTFSYKKLVLFSIPLIGFALLTSLQQSIDLFFIKAMLHSEEAPGFYTANQNISRIPYFALSAFSMVIFPSISKNVSQNLHEQSRKMIRKSLRLILIILIPGTLLISATSSQVLELLFSETYLPGASSLSILIFGMGFLTIFTILANILNGAGKPLHSLVISFGGVLITSIFCFILIPAYGINGAAIATTIGGFLIMLIASFFVYRTFKVLLPIGSVIKITFSSLVMFVFVIFFKPPLGFLPLIYVGSLTLYILILAFLKELSKDDLNEFKKLLPARIFSKK